jgi:hypothetical protein
MRRARITALGLFAFASLACGRSPEVPRAFHDALACSAGESIPGDLGAIRDSDPTVPGRPSDLMSRASQLVAAKDWDRAVLVLQRVTRGEGQDDRANIELAAYDLGVAYYHLKRADLSFEQMKPIALDRGNVRHREALVWLGNIALVGTHDAKGSSPVDYVYAYEPDEMAVFNMPDHQELWYLLSFLRGRAAFRRGRYEEVLDTMDRVAKYGAYKDLADGCSTLAREALRQNLPPPPTSLNDVRVRAE